jgi:hypothetical protein
MRNLRGRPLSNWQSGLVCTPIFKLWVILKLTPRLSGGVSTRAGKVL